MIICFGLIISFCDGVEHVFDNSVRYVSDAISTQNIRGSRWYHGSQPTKPRPHQMIRYSDNIDASIPEVLLENEVLLLAHGHDGRTRVNRTTDWPHSCIVNLQMEYTKPGTGQKMRSYGSGTMVSPLHVLTCSHNIHNISFKDKWAEHVSVTPALNDDSAPFGVLKCTRAYVFDRWVQGDSSDDMALLVLEKPIGFQTGWFGMFGSNDDQQLRCRIAITGYPGDKESPTGTGICKTMWTMEEEGFDEIRRDFLHHTIDTFAGNSGSGIYTMAIGGHQFVVPHILGVHVAGSQEEQINIGTRISLEKFTKIIEWMEKTSHLYKGSVEEIADEYKQIITDAYSSVRSRDPYETHEPSNQVRTRARTEASRIFFRKLAEFRDLTSLDLRKLTVNNNHGMPLPVLANDIVQAIDRLNLLTSLHLGNGEIIGQAEDWRLLVQTIGRLNRLVELSLSPMSREGKMIFLAGIRDLGPLTTLGLTINSEKDLPEIAQEIGRFARLTKITLHSSPLPFPRGELILQGGGSCVSMRYISVASPMFFLAPEICRLVTLTSLNLTNNNLYASGAKVLARHIGQLQGLTDLDLSDNFIGMEGGGSIVQNDESASVLISEICGLAQLTALNLSKNSIGICGVYSLAQRIGRLNNLNLLNLRGNLLQNMGLRMLAPRIEALEHLTELDLSWNFYGSEEAKLLLPHLTRLPVLTLLRLSGSFPYGGADNLDSVKPSFHDALPRCTIEWKDPDCQGLQGICS